MKCHGFSLPPQVHKGYFGLTFVACIKSCIHLKVVELIFYAVAVLLVIPPMGTWLTNAQSGQSNDTQIQDIPTGRWEGGGGALLWWVGGPLYISIGLIYILLFRWVVTRYTNQALYEDLFQ